MILMSATILTGNHLRSPLHDPLFCPKINNIFRFGPIKKIVEFVLSLRCPRRLFIRLERREDVRDNIGFMLRERFGRSGGGCLDDKLDYPWRV